MWTGRLPHLNGLPRLPGVPHLHVNRALGSTRSHRDLAKSRRVLGEISFISPKCLSSRRDLVAISSHWVLGEISFISQKSLSYRRDLVCLAKIFFISPESRRDLVGIPPEIAFISCRCKRHYKSRRVLIEISNSCLRACVISARKAKHLDVTTMFTYSHANTPLGQSERSYYLSYFINSYIDINKF